MRTAARADQRTLRRPLPIPAASLGAVVGFVTAWSLWSVTRLPVEIALIDSKPALIRYAVTFVVPPLAGLLAEAIARVL